jgi:hypothetical protein
MDPESSDNDPKAWQDGLEEDDSFNDPRLWLQGLDAEAPGTEHAMIAAAASYGYDDSLSAFISYIPEST